MRKTIRQTYKIDKKLAREAWAELAACAGTSGDTAWVDALPEAPPLPKGTDDVVVVLVDQRTKGSR